MTRLAASVVHMIVIPDLIRDPASLAASKNSGTPGQARGDGSVLGTVGVEM
jgi:hypothetical protein